MVTQSQVLEAIYGKQPLYSSDSIAAAQRVLSLCAEAAEAAVERVRLVALGENSEEWVRAAGPLGTVARSAILAALDGE